MRKHILILNISVALCAMSKPVANTTDSVTHTLKDVEVSAQQAPRTAQSTAPLYQYTCETLLTSGVTDVSDALHRLPGVTLRDYGGAGGLKTVAVRGFGASHTGVCYDGVPLSDAQTGQIDLSRYSVDNVDAISLVVGDNDDIFIPARLAASPATVNISTVPVLQSYDIEAKMRVGSFGLLNPFVRVGVPCSKTAAINFVGEYTHADNDYPFRLVNGSLVTTERRTNSRMNSGHAEVNFITNLNTANTLSAKAYYYDNQRCLPGPVIYYNSENHERLHEQNAMGQAQLRSRVSDQLTVSTIAKFNFAASMYSDKDGKYPGGELHQNYWQREYYVSGAVLWTPRQQWVLDYSADYFYNSLNSNLISDVRPYRNSILQSITVKYRTKRLIIMARALGSIYINGAKDGTAARNASKLSPSISISWQPMGSELLFVRASYKNIFRMPTFNEAYFDHFGSQDVKPESTDQLNIGATYTLQALVFTVDGYLNNVKDMIVAVPYNMFLWGIVNLGKVRTLGLDATVELSFTPVTKHNVSMMGSASLQRAMPRTNPESSDWMKQVAYIPKYSGSLSIGWENPWVNLSMHGTGVSSRYTTNNNLPETKIDGYIELGASAWRSIKIKKGQLSLRFDLINLLNKQYCVIARYPMPGRSYKLTLTYKY